MYARQYVENDLLDRSPVELIRLLYSKAIEKLQLAARHTRANDVRERNACLARVMEIVAELQGALNLEAGGELAVQLAALYDYAQRQLIEAAAEPAAVAPLEEVRVLLVNLHEGWRDCEPPPAEQQRPGEGGDADRAAEGGNSDRAAEGASSDRAAEGMDGASGSGGQEFAIEEITSPLGPADYVGARLDRVWTL
jgi:flagellar protein FliS